MTEQVPAGPHERAVGPETEMEALRTSLMEAHERAASTWLLTLRVLTAQADDLDRLRAERDALALLLGECADELETEIHCRLSGDRATLRLSLPQRAKAKLREIGLPHGLTPNVEVTRADGAKETR